jgi:hypothetical protein
MQLSNYTYLLLFAETSDLRDQRPVRLPLEPSTDSEPSCRSILNDAAGWEGRLL